MSSRTHWALVVAVLAVALVVDYAFHLDSPKPNRPAIVQLQRQVVQLQRQVAELRRQVSHLEHGAGAAG